MSSANTRRSTGSSRHWVVTYPNAPASIYEAIISAHDAYAADTTQPCGLFGGTVRYFIGQRERGDGGLDHLQCYITFRDKITLNTCKRRIGNAHCESRLGTHEEARSYCSKTDTRIGGPWEFGKPVKGQGQRTDIEALQMVLDQGDVPLTEVISEHFGLYLRYHKGIEKYRMLKSQPRHFPCAMIVYWGVTGAGKSHKAYNDFPGAFYVPAGSGNWYDGYDGESTIIFDEFSGDIPFRFLLRLCDKYPLLLPIKGGHVQCRASTIVFTSNTDPRIWYPEHDPAPLLRRATITHFPIAFTVNM